MTDEFDDLEEFLDDCDDDKPVSFGKYKGQTPREILEVDASYIVWAWENSQLLSCSRELYEEALEELEAEEVDHEYDEESEAELWVLFGENF